MNPPYHRAPLARAIAFALLTLILALGAAFAGRRLAHPNDDRMADALVERASSAAASGDSVAAVVALERARMLAPRDAAVRAAIAEARVRHPEPALVRASRNVDAREWAAIVVASGTIGAGAIAFAVLRRRRIPNAVVGPALALAALGAGGVALSRHYVPAVVSSGATTMLVAPYEGAGAAGPLTAGTVVLRGDAHGAFVSVSTAAGERGWVASSSVVPVVRLGS